MARILVIKLSALGDLVLAFAAFAAIRARHPTSEVTLLTTAAFAGLCAASPWFDRIEIDDRPSWWNVRRITALRRRLRGFDFVYDLQTSSRSSRYFRLAGRPPWSGIARGASHPHDNPERDRMHTRARQADQLARAGIAEVPLPDLSWLAAHGPMLPLPYALLVPGAAAHRPGKRWPTANFAALALELDSRGIRPVVVGAAGDAPLGQAIARSAPALDLAGRTSLLDLGGLCARACLAVGNDTGPMHLAASMGCRSIVLFSGQSDPALTVPIGPDASRVHVLCAQDIADIEVARVAALLGPRH